MKKIILILITVGLLIACATKYRELEFRGGYTDRKMAEDIFVVRFTGNGFTSKRLVADYALYRCAEITREQKAFYFIVLSSNSDTIKTSSTTTYTKTISGNGYNAQTTDVNKSATEITIKIFKEKPDIDFYYDAIQVLKSMDVERL